MKRYLRLQLLLLCLLFAAPAPSLAAPQNVTQLLATHPDYSTFNTLLSTYGVAAQINSRTTITVLCPANRVLDPFLSSLGSSPDRLTMFNVLSFHVLLDYEDPSTLQSLRGGFATITTLFQTTGLAAGSNGILNISISRGAARIRQPAAVTLSYATIGSPLALFPFNISLLSIDAVLIPAGVLNSPPPPPVNLTQILAQAANFSRFVSLLSSTGVDNVFQSHDSPPGITVFAPMNEAFDKVGSLATLSKAQQVSLLEFHALASFFPTQELITAVGQQNTLATGSVSGTYTLTISQNNSGPNLIIDTGVEKVPISGTLFSSLPVAIFMIDSVLLPKEIFGAGPASTPVTTPSSSPKAAPGSSPIFNPPSFSPSTPFSASPSPTSVGPKPATTSAPSPSPYPSPSPISLSSPPSPPPVTLVPGPSPYANSPSPYANGPEAFAPESPTSFSSPSFDLHYHYYKAMFLLAAVSLLSIV